MSSFHESYTRQGVLSAMDECLEVFAYPSRDALSTTAIAKILPSTFYLLLIYEPTVPQLSPPDLALNDKHSAFLFPSVLPHTWYTVYHAS